MKKSLNDFIVAFAAVGVIISIAMFFCPCVTINDGVTVGIVGGTKNPFTGIEATFGYTAKISVGNSFVSRTIFNFSPFNLLTFILFIAGGLMLLFAIFTDFFNKPMFRFVAGIIIALAGVLMLLMCFMILKGNYTIYSQIPGWASIVGGLFGIFNGAMLIAYNAKILFFDKPEEPAETEEK